MLLSNRLLLNITTLILKALNKKIIGKNARDINFSFAVEGYVKINAVKRDIDTTPVQSWIIMNSKPPKKIEVPIRVACGSMMLTKK